MPQFAWKKKRNPRLVAPHAQALSTIELIDFYVIFMLKTLSATG
jgi:hypothetical protein